MTQEYKEALKRIANGEPEPQAIAEKALENGNGPASDEAKSYTAPMLTQAEYRRILNATNSEASVWNADLMEYAVFPGDMREKAEEIGEVEDILWESSDHENEELLMVALNDPLLEHTRGAE